MFTYKIDERSHLKLLEPRDAEALFTLIQGSKEHLRTWLSWVNSTEQVKDSEAFIRSTMKQFGENNGFQAGIWHEGHLAGVIGFHRIDWTNKLTTIGYWLGEDYQGLGLMTRACEAIVDYALTDLKLARVEIRAATENKRSQAVPERLGFVREGELRHSEWLYDRYVNHVVYGLLAEEWGRR
ncbi:GNAT family N-acetyltransferase [Shouchella shacheensis]|uniref:GNAT family N-acetyltransferase n=1 Tax=Shouchella shacheensis TaxID=1649580 RepID=UPI00073FD913|nr:GNAT family protein [Shouchella shacheensis]